MQHSGDEVEKAGVNRPATAGLGELAQAIVEKGNQLRFGSGTDLGGVYLAVAKEHQGGNIANAVFGRGILVVLDIQLAHLDPSGIFRRDFLQDRPDHAAGSAPFGPVIHQHRLLGLQYLGLESVISDMGDSLAHREILR